MVIASAIAGIMGAGIVLYSNASMRMVARNMATNHSHEVARGTFDRMLNDLHGASSRFNLLTFDGTNFVSSSATSGSDLDLYTQQYITPRANAVEYMKFAGGPYKITGDSGGSSPVASTATAMQVDFGVNGALPYTPSVGDKVQIPLINSAEFYITGVTTAPTVGNTKGTITLSGAVGFTLYTSGTAPSGVVNPVTTGYFYKRQAYSVWNDPALKAPTYQIRFHPNYPQVSGTNTVIVRYNVTSASPFALLATAAATASDNLNLRLSLEAYDVQYTGQNFLNGTTTLESIIPSRTQPPPISTGT